MAWQIQVSWIGGTWLGANWRVHCQRFPCNSRFWSGLWNAATATIHRIPLCNGFALELNTIHSGNCSLTKFFSVPDLRHFPVSQSINSSNMQSFDSTEEMQESLVFRSSLSPDWALFGSSLGWLRLGGCTSSESGGAHFCYSRIDFWPRAFFVQSSMRGFLPKYQFNWIFFHSTKHCIFYSRKRSTLQSWFFITWHVDMFCFSRGSFFGIWMPKQSKLKGPLLVPSLPLWLSCEICRTILPHLFFLVLLWTSPKHQRIFTTAHLTLPGR